MKIQRVDLFSVPYTQYGVQHAFTKGLQSALQRLGVKSSRFFQKEMAEDKVLDALRKDAPDCTAGFNFMFSKESQIEPLVGIPHLSIIIDSASYFPLLLHAPNTIIGFVDEDSVHFLQMLGAKYVMHLPHAIESSMLEAKNSPRDLEVVLCGSYIDADEVLAIWKKVFLAESVARLVTLAEQVLESDHLSQQHAFMALIEERGAFEQELRSKGINYFQLMNTLDHYIRGIDRIRILEAIERPVHIFGAKRYEPLWKKAVKDSKKLIFHDEVPYVELQSILRRSRVVINSVPTYKRALHERMLMGLACGATVLCNDSVYVRNEFGSSSALPTILSPNYTQANALIEAALQDEDARFRAVVQTHDTIRNKHTWDVRAATLLKTLPPILEALLHKKQI